MPGCERGYMFNHAVHHLVAKRAVGMESKGQGMRTFLIFDGHATNHAASDSTIIAIHNIYKTQLQPIGVRGPDIYIYIYNILYIIYHILYIV